jgi:homoserine kinase
MKDKIHQPYRMALVRRSFFYASVMTLTDTSAQIPGLPEILASLTPQSHPGLLGICLSGAGPTILALATDNFDVRTPLVIHVSRTYRF